VHVYFHTLWFQPVLEQKLAFSASELFLFINCLKAQASYFKLKQ